MTGGLRHSWPLKIVAVSTVAGLSSKMFVYHAAMGVDDFDGDVFECVASLSQMTELPPDHAAASSGEGDEVVPYYRTDTVNFICRCADEADELWEKIQGDVQDLLANHRAAQQLDVIETATIN
jgi:hypothetical protein